jgi:putative methylase
MRSKKELAVTLSKLNNIINVDRKLEQYQTESELAADIIWNAYLQGDIEESEIYDLGCGNGIFGIGALLMGAKHCTFVDIDNKAIEILKSNLIEEFIEKSTIINKNISEIHFNSGDYNEVNEGGNCKRIVIMNPPFGTKKEHADREFLEKAFTFADKIYSIHMRESYEFLDKFSKSKEYEIINYIEYNFGIKKSHPKHIKKRLNIPVILAIIVKNKHSNN